ncbi:MAG: class I SAM-dependent methyltransferase [Armatimonadetes bacterium]|nr:class I SAM-dependent methyltransferase [Armatimonadota bacterium]
MDFSLFDRRGYPTVSAPQGYDEWAPTYEDTVLELMDVRLLERLESVGWSQIQAAADLACGTGRIGQWMRARGVLAIDGVDVSEGMLERARLRGVYRRLVRSDLGRTSLPGASYEAVTCVLADEHLADLAPLYREASRLVSGDGVLVLVSYHPIFMMTSGMPTHFDRSSGESVAIETYVHLFGEHVRAARRHGFRLEELEEAIIDESWLSVKPKWKAFLGRPFSFASVWKPAAPRS